MKAIKELILIVIFAFCFVDASSQVFKLGTSYLPIGCTIEEFDHAWIVEYPQRDLEKYEYENHAVRHAVMSPYMSFTFWFSGKKENRRLSRAIVDKIPPSKKIAKKEIELACYEIQKEHLYKKVKKRKGDIGLYNYVFQYIGDPRVKFIIITFKDSQGLIHCSSICEYP